MNKSSISCLAPVELNNQSTVCIDKMLTVQHSVLLLLNILNIILNSLTVVAVACCKTLHNIPNALIFSLAVTDVLEGVLSLTTDLMFFVWDIQCSRNCENDFAEVEPSWLLEFRFVLATSFTCNYFCLLIIAVQQWLYIFQPFLHDRLVTPRITTCVILICMTLSAVINLDIVLVSSPVKSQNEVYDRRVFALPVLHSAASVAMFALYFHITLIAFRQVRRLSPQIADISGVSVNEPPKTYKIRSNWRFLKMFFTSFGVFFTCLSPLIYYRAFHGQSPEFFFEWGIIFGLETLPAVHYLANFFVFAKQHKDLNNVFKKSLRKVCHWNS